MAQRKSTKRTSKRTSGTKSRPNMPEEVRDEIISLVLIFIAAFVFLCNFHIIGKFGDFISGIMFGLFGFSAYILPVAVALICFFKLNRNLEDIPVIKTVGIMMTLFLISMIFEMIFAVPDKEAAYDAETIKSIWTTASEGQKSGGIFAGSVCFLLVRALDKVGTWLLIILLLIIGFVLITGKSFLRGVAGTASSTRRAAADYRERMRQRNEENAAIREERRRQSEEARKIRRVETEREKERRRREQAEREQAAEDEAVIKQVSGVPDYKLVREEEKPVSPKAVNDMHEILPDSGNEDEGVIGTAHAALKNHSEMHQIRSILPEDPVTEEYVTEEDEAEGYETDETPEIPEADDEEDIVIPGKKDRMSGSIFAEGDHEISNGGRTFKSTGAEGTGPAPKQPARPKKIVYKIPPVSLLNKPAAKDSDDRNSLSETAAKLEEVFASFNVKVEVTGFSQGPTVTRYEMIPETGVKVSRILGLADDIKLNLAAADIRIEAPIPGKSAIGIEVPNKKSTAVSLRELLESEDYKKAESKISFAVGKDLAGKVIIADIAKMPHMLIAGGTGSGKSVCINTLIMSILFKARPDEVKMIMVDPKVVELSVYNGIPHLLIPVVTDPKKASAALNWAVNEMNKRYEAFAEFGVRNLKGYNEAIEGRTDENGEHIPKMYQLVVIVDELADLMMVAGKEVEESICRLAQLARAAGIHLIIATQRPSVDVITGLIKANMPSRVAFAVSSGVDSRTILDTDGAEKLLGKGDMLFYPQGYPKPARLQGAYVDDKEVQKVADFIRSNSGEEDREKRNEIEQQMAVASASSSSAGTSGGNGAGTDNDSGQDEFLEPAARLIVETGKSSIGMLQRKFKIGFNRAARIMDALSEAGIVGPEDGTKPRAILMDQAQLEEFLKGNE
ncbi:MAG: DNA translocase FtsK [Lachnospiraceae bacterium]|nr:DNA translocase FtsK [Lachnospiraceae bacterium]